MKNSQQSVEPLVLHIIKNKEIIFDNNNLGIVGEVRICKTTGNVHFYLIFLYSITFFIIRKYYLHNQEKKILKSQRNDSWHGHYHEHCVNKNKRAEAGSRKSYAGVIKPSRPRSPQGYTATCMPGLWCSQSFGTHLECSVFSLRGRNPSRKRISFSSGKPPVEKSQKSNPE